MNYQGICGFDASTYQDSPDIVGHIDFQKMSAWGANFTILKAGQGNWADPDFATSWKNAKGILPRASYWYYDNRYPPKDQARRYFDIIKYDLEGICWLDLEDRQAGIYAGWHNWYDFIEELKAIYPGVRIGIYTGFYYWMDYTIYATRAQRDYFGQYPLWISNYGAKGSDPLKPNYSTILIPLPWLDYKILQTGTPIVGLDVGVESKEVDYNQFSGTLFEFANFFGVKLPQPTEGDPMYQGKTSMIAKVWDTISGQQIKELPAGTVVKGDAPAAGYAHITSPVNGYTKTIWLVNYAPTVVVPPPPPPPTPTDGFVASFDGTITLTDSAGVKHSAHVAFDVPMVTE
jgi:GH25 family lysozyme M1 (1,4-beta-N-acetylmuramidase)